MLRWRALGVCLFLIMLGYGLGNPDPDRAQATTTVTINPAPTTCVQSIMKFYDPNMTAPMTIAIFKYLAAAQQCQTTMMNSAFCFPNTMLAAGMTLQATAAGASGHLGMNPSCAWNCTGACGNAVSITGSQDGLPVELLDFKVTAVPKTPSPLKELSENDSLTAPRS